MEAVVEDAVVADDEDDVEDEGVETGSADELDLGSRSRYLVGVEGGCDHPGGKGGITGSSTGSDWVR